MVLTNFSLPYNGTEPANILQNCIWSRVVAFMVAHTILCLCILLSPSLSLSELMIHHKLATPLIVFGYTRRILGQGHFQNTHRLQVNRPEGLNKLMENYNFDITSETKDRLMFMCVKST